MMKKRVYTSEFRGEAVKMVLASSKPVAVVARELGINEGTLANWVNKHRHAHPGAEQPLDVSERSRLKELENEARELRWNEIF